MNVECMADEIMEPLVRDRGWYSEKIFRHLVHYHRLDQYVWTNKLAWTVRGSSLQF